MKKILIVSNHFPPLNSMASKRYGIMCKYLGEFGYEPYIITSKVKNGCYLSSKLDLEIPVFEDRISRIGTLGGAYPVRNLPVMLLMDYLKKQNLESRILDAWSYGWYENVKEKADLKDYEDIDIIVGTYPDISNVLAAKYLARKLKKPVVIEIRDLISDYREADSGMQRCLWLDRRLEQMLLRNVDGIITVTRGFEKILKRRYPDKKIKTVYNGWDGEKRVRENSEKKYLYYAGSLYEHRIESLTVLLKAIEKIYKEENLEMIIRSEGPGRLDFKVKRMIKSFGLEHVVKLLDAENEAVIKREQSGAFINIVLSSVHHEDKALMSTVPGKVFELLNQEAPALAVVPAGSEVNSILKYTDKGLGTIDVEKLVRFIKSDYAKYRGNDKILFFSRIKQTEQLCKFLDQIVK